MKIQDIATAAIIATVCIAWLLSIVFQAIGRPVTPELQGVINTTFVAFAVVVPTWLQAGRAEKAKQEAYQAGLSLRRHD